MYISFLVDERYDFWAYFVMNLLHLHETENITILVVEGDMFNFM